MVKSVSATFYVGDAQDSLIKSSENEDGNNADSDKVSILLNNSSLTTFLTNTTAELPEQSLSNFPKDEYKDVLQNENEIQRAENSLTNLEFPDDSSFLNFLNHQTIPFESSSTNFFSFPNTPCPFPPQVQVSDKKTSKKKSLPYKENFSYFAYSSPHDICLKENLDLVHSFTIPIVNIINDRKAKKDRERNISFPNSPIPIRRRLENENKESAGHLKLIENPECENIPKVELDSNGSLLIFDDIKRSSNLDTTMKTLQATRNFIEANKSTEKISILYSNKEMKDNNTSSFLSNNENDALFNTSNDRNKSLVQSESADMLAVSVSEKFRDSERKNSNDKKVIKTSESTGLGMNHPPALTVPEPFDFHLNNRKQSNRSSSGTTKRDFDDKPSHLSDSNKAKNEKESFRKIKIDDIKLAEYHSSLNISQAPQKLTVPHSPVLNTKYRSAGRQIQLLTTEELELKKIQSKPAFKAQPMDPRILHSAGDLGVPKIEKPKLTSPKEFKLRTKNLLNKRKGTTLKKNQVDQPFKANPLPIHILDHVIGVPSKKEAPITVPVSPIIHKRKSRHSISDSISERKLQPAEFKARPLPPKSDPPFEPKLEHKFTISEPFEFQGEALRSAAIEKWHKKIEETLEEEKKAGTFHAQPARYLFTVDNLPVIPEKPLTEPEPFIFHTDLVLSRITSKNRSSTGESKSDCENSKDGAYHNKRRSVTDYGFEFKARSMPKSAPFVPKKSTKPLTQHDDEIMFQTEIRSHERSNFDLLVKKKEEQAQLRKEIEQKLKEEQIIEEIKRERKKTIHSAQPIRKYKELIMESSDKPLTVPEGPDLSVNKRIPLDSLKRVSGFPLYLTIPEPSGQIVKKKKII